MGLGRKVGRKVVGTLLNKTVMQSRTQKKWTFLHPKIVFYCNNGVYDDNDDVDYSPSNEYVSLQRRVGSS